MPNLLVFNNVPENLKTSIYGADGDTLRPIAVDSDGEILLSSLSAVPVTATNFDIRDLSSTTDSVSVTATDLDIRNLSGTQDSVTIYADSFVEDNVSTVVSSGTTYLLAKEIGAYRENSYFLRNLSGAAVTIAVQVAPVNTDAYYVDNSTAQSVAVSGNGIAAASVAMKYARLRVVATTNTSVAVYYNGRA